MTDRSAAWDDPLVVVEQVEADLGHRFRYELVLGAALFFCFGPLAREFSEYRQVNFHVTKVDPDA